MIDYLIIIEPAEDGSGFGAYTPDLPGCIATGHTLDEARERIRQSIPLYIASLRAHGETVPPPAAHAEHVSVAA